MVGGGWGLELVNFFYYESKFKIKFFAGGGVGSAGGGLE